MFSGWIRGIQLDHHYSRRSREDCLHVPLWHIRFLENAIWVVKRPGNLSEMYDGNIFGHGRKIH